MRHVTFEAMYALATTKAISWSEVDHKTHEALISISVTAALPLALAVWPFPRASSSNQQ
jgi:hypothetical protein